jgi:tetratricopeptide (TPR) repeat protein
MTNWHFTQEKRRLANLISDRLLLLSRMQAGDEYMDSGNYLLAQQSYNSVFGIARNETELEQESILAEKLQKLSLYFEISDRILLGEMNEVSEYYAHAKQSYDDAAELARQLGDLELRKDILVRLFELEQKRKAISDAEVSFVIEEEARVAQQLFDNEVSRAWEFMESARQARREADYLGSMTFYEQARQIYRELEIRDDRLTLLDNELREVEELMQLELLEAEREPAAEPLGTDDYDFED